MLFLLRASSRMPAALILDSGIGPEFLGSSLCYAVFLALQYVILECVWEGGGRVGSGVRVVCVSLIPPNPFKKYESGTLRPWPDLDGGLVGHLLKCIISLHLQKCPDGGLAGHLLKCRIVLHLQKCPDGGLARHLLKCRI